MYLPLTPPPRCARSQPEALTAEAEPPSEEVGGDGAGMVLADEGGAGAAEDAGACTNEVGTLKLRVMRTYFVSRKQSEFTLLGAVRHLPPQPPPHPPPHPPTPLIHP